MLDLVVQDGELLAAGHAALLLLIGQVLHPVHGQLGVGTVQVLCTARRRDGKGTYNLYSPFAELGITLIHALDVLLGVALLDQRQPPSP